MTSAAGDRIRLLVMSVGSLVGTNLLECLDALGRDRFELIGLNSDPDAANNFRLDVCYLSPRASDRAALSALLDRVTAGHAPELIIPTRDDDVVVLSRWAQGRPRARALAGSPAIAEVIRDKWASHEWATARQLPFARSAIDAAGATRLRRELGFPLVAKPRDGFGSNGVRLLLTEEHLSAVLAAGGYVVQECLDAPRTLSQDDLRLGMPLWFAPLQLANPSTLCLLDDRGCEFLAAWVSEVRCGAAVRTVLIDAPPLRQLAIDFAEAAWRDGWRGPLNLQTRVDSTGRYVPIELAGRLIGSVAALHALGVPVVADVLKRFLPSFDCAAATQPQPGAAAVKQVVTYGVSAEHRLALRDTGVWRRPG
jgi:carbamoyl-phosphate synthase large subunit